MDHFDQEDVLRSMEILVDTREQQTARSTQRYDSFGVPWRRQTLKYGDYTYNCILPEGTPLYEADSALEPLAVVERKMSLDELAGCFGRDRKRFEREFERAQAAGSRVYLVVENGSWESIIYHRYRSRLHPNSFLASLTAWTVRYGMTPIFCKAETSGKLIKEILYRDLKERLERGEFG